MKTTLGLDDDTTDVYVQDEVSGPSQMFFEFAKRVRNMMTTGIAATPFLAMHTCLTPLPFSEQLARVYDVLEIFVLEAEAEHRDRLAGYVPTTVPEYLRKRFNSSGCYPGFWVME